MINKFILC